MKVFRKIVAFFVVCGILLSGGFLLVQQSWKNSVKVHPKLVVEREPFAAIWAAHTWVGDKHSQIEYREFAQKMKDHNVIDIYVHTGPFESDGKVAPEKYPYAKEFLASVKGTYPEVQIHAWLGQVEKTWGGPLDVSDEETKNNIVVTSEQMYQLGFDGVHLNIEPILDNDQNFLDILKGVAEMKRAYQGILSLATDDIEPFIGGEAVLGAFIKNLSFWSKSYYQEVGEYVDQIAMMTYDSTITEDYLYAKFVEWQTKNISKTLGNSIRIYIGIPTYDEGENFHPEAENIETGIWGITKALQTIQNQNIGVALYAGWTTSEDEWKYYDDHYLKQDRTP